MMKLVQRGIVPRNVIARQTGEETARNATNPLLLFFFFDVVRSLLTHKQRRGGRVSLRAE